MRAVADVNVVLVAGRCYTDGMKIEVTNGIVGTVTVVDGEVVGLTVYLDEIVGDDATSPLTVRKRILTLLTRRKALPTMQLLRFRAL